MPEHHPQIYSFDDFVLDLARGRLLRAGEEAKLRPKSFDVLKYLVEHNGRLVSKNDLLQVVWPDAFVTDGSLVQCLIDVRRALGDDSQRYIKTVPRRGYIFEAKVSDSAHLSVPAEQSVAVASKLDEIYTRHEISQEEEPSIVHPPLQGPHGLRLKLDLKFAVIGLASLALALSLSYLWVMRISGQPASKMPRTIAVLPFKPLVADHRDEALELGVADTLITRLGSLKRLIVRPTAAIRKYSALDHDPLAAGREQKVEAVLEGSLHREGEKVRVTVRLLDVKDGSSLWSFQSVEYFTDIFAAQDTISEKIAKALALELSDAEQRRLTKRHTSNRAAYQFYYKGRYHLFRRTGPDVEKAIDYFQQAIALDPNYALAHEGLGFAYASLCFLAALAPKEAMPRAKESVMQALKIDGLFAEAHATSGQFKFSYDWDWSGAEKELKLALDLNPNSADVHLAYAFYLTNIGRSKEAIAEIKKALELDPASLFLNKNLGQFLYLVRDYDLAIEQLQKTLDLDPNFVTAYQWIGESYEQKGDYERSIVWDMKSVTTPEKIKALKEAHAASGWRGYWQKRIVLAKEDAKRAYSEPYHLAVYHARLGDKEKAFVYLSKAYEERSHWLIYLKVDPKLDTLRSDSRFTALLHHIGLSM
jgi:DNA-binding winged helix-turn-helix (wHTH) protein/TolB-like protein/lipoprotein NlpI